MKSTVPLKHCKHTPGPWRTVENNFIAPKLMKELADGGARIVWCESKQNEVGDVAYVLPVDGHNGNANARLIAASPTLYEFVSSRAKAGETEAKKTLDLLNLSY